MLRKLLTSQGFVVVVLLTIAFSGYDLWMAIAGPQKITEAAVESSRKAVPVTLGVELPFTPEAFHIEKLQQFGRIRRVRGTTVQVAFADLEQARQLSRRFYWIRRIDVVPPT